MNSTRPCSTFFTASTADLILSHDELIAPATHNNSSHNSPIHNILCHITSAKHGIEMPEPGIFQNSYIKGLVSAKSGKGCLF